MRNTVGCLRPNGSGRRIHPACPREAGWPRLPVLPMLLAGLLAVGGCGETVVRIGFLADLSGRGSGTGIAARNGAILAVDALNADGGIRGKQVVLHIKDDRGTAETAVVVDRELVGEDVALAIGHLNSGAGLAGLPVLLDAGIPVISPAMGTEKLTGLADGFFRLVPESTGQGVVLAKEMIRGTASDARVAVLLEENNLAYGEAVAGGFLPLWRQSGRTVAVEARYQTGDMAMLGQVVDTLLQSEAEAYLIIGGGLDLAVFSQKIRRQVPNACIASGMWAMTTDFLRNAGKAGDGVLFPQLFSPRSETPEWLSFVKSYRDRFGEDPLFSSGTAYEAVMVAATAMRQVKTLSMETIHAALLAASPYAGLQEDIAFDAHGDCNRTYRVVTVQDGAFVEVLP